MKLEALRDELVQVASVVKEHEEASQKAMISTVYLRKIRQGKSAILDNKGNRDLLKQLIKIYRQIGRRKELELQNVL